MKNTMKITTIYIMLLIICPTVTLAQEETDVLETSDAIPEVKKIKELESDMQEEVTEPEILEEYKEPEIIQEEYTEPEEEEVEEEFDVMTLDPAGSPVFGPGGGKYPVGQELNIFTLQNGAKVHVTFDGSTPSNFTDIFESPHVFEEVGEYTVRARCSAENYRDSSIIQFVYLIQTTASVPRIKAVPLDEQPFNTSDATATYLGRYQEGVKLSFESETPGAKYYFTTSKKGETSVEPSLDSHYTNDEIIISDKGLHTVRVKAISDNTFISEEILITVRVYPRPPRPAFHIRSKRAMLSDMDVAYYKMADRHKDETMRPVDLVDFIALVLNPDVGMCVDCRINKQEQEILKEQTEHMKYLEGLHVDEGMKLHHGFITRGSCFDFIYVLNKKMYKLRERRKEVGSKDDLINRQGKEL